MKGIDHPQGWNPGSIPGTSIFNPRTNHNMITENTEIPRSVDTETAARLWMKANPDLCKDAACRMMLTGGSFARCIGQAYIYADSINREKLLSAFPTLFAEYAEKVEAEKRESAL